MVKLLSMDLNKRVLIITGMSLWAQDHLKICRLASNVFQFCYIMHWKNITYCVRLCGDNTPPKLLDIRAIAHNTILNYFRSLEINLPERLAKEFTTVPIYRSEERLRIIESNLTLRWIFLVMGSESLKRWTLH